MKYQPKISDYLTNANKAFKTEIRNANREAFNLSKGI